MYPVIVLLFLTVAFTGCSTWVDTERQTSSAFAAWWLQLSPQAKQKYEQQEKEGRLAFVQWYESQPLDHRAHYEEIDKQREKSSLLFKGQMQQGVVQEQLILP